VPKYVVEVNLRPTVSRPFCLGVRRPSGTRDQSFFLLEISFRQLRVCYLVAPSLTRGWVCNLLYTCFWALPEQSLLGRSPAELTAIFYCINWDSLSLEGQVPVFISPRKMVAQLYPRALGSLFVASYDSLGYRSTVSLHYYYCYYLKCIMGLACGSGITKTQHTNTHITQNNTTLKRNSAQSYTNNKGQIAHNEYNANVKLSLSQAVEGYSCLGCRSSRMNNHRKN
jgi:hypothetical protein